MSDVPQADNFLGVLYEKAFQTKQLAEAMGKEDGRVSDTYRQVALAKNALVHDLINEYVHHLTRKG